MLDAARYGQWQLKHMCIMNAFSDKSETQICTRGYEECFSIQPDPEQTLKQRNGTIYNAFKRLLSLQYVEHHQSGPKISANYLDND